MALTRMRLIKDAYSYIKEQDPDTAISKSAFSKFIKQGYVKSSSVGVKTLVNLDDVDKFLENGFDFITEKESNNGVIKINEKISLYTDISEETRKRDLKTKFK